MFEDEGADYYGGACGYEGGRSGVGEDVVVEEIEGDVVVLAGGLEAGARDGEHPGTGV